MSYSVCLQNILWINRYFIYYILLLFFSVFLLAYWWDSHLFKIKALVYGTDPDIGFAFHSYNIQYKPHICMSFNNNSWKLICLPAKDPVGMISVPADHPAKVWPKCLVTEKLSKKHVVLLCFYGNWCKLDKWANISANNLPLVFCLNNIIWKMMV